MNIMQKFIEKAADNNNAEHVTLAFIGDSVTQGCFEIYWKEDGSIGTVFDKEHAYHALLSKIFSMLYPSVPVNIINAGINGDSAPSGLKRLERDVLRYNPDMVVVGFGLNDSGGGLENIGTYREALTGIFDVLHKKGIEVIFLTPNMMNTSVSVHMQDEAMRNIAREMMRRQKEGILDAYVEAAKEVCEEKQVCVCDCYEKWKLMSRNGVDVTELLSNKVNHPTREMNWMTAFSLVETMMQD